MGREIGKRYVPFDVLQDIKGDPLERVRTCSVSQNKASCFYKDDRLQSINNINIVLLQSILGKMFRIKIAFDDTSY